MANLGAFSRDFVSGFNTTFRTFQQKAESDARLELARKADARAQRNADQADADRAAEEAYFNAQYNGGGVAAKAAPASGLPTPMPPPNKLGMNIGSDEYIEPARTDPRETDPALNEEMEAGAAKARGFTPAPPSAVPPPEEVITLEPRSDLGGPKGALPYKGRLTRGIVADIRAREDAAREQANKDREFGLRERDLKDVQETRAVQREQMRQQMTQEDFKQAQTKAQEFSKQAFAYADNIKAPDTTPLNAPELQESLGGWLDTLERGYATTPDGRSVKVDRTPAGVVVTTIDDESGKPISKDVFKTVGDLKAATMMFGQITQGEKFGEWMAATSAEALGNKVRGTKAEAAVNEFRDMIFSAPPEQRLDPGWQQQMLGKAKEIEGRFGDLVMDEVKTPVMDPETGQPAMDNNNRPVSTVTKQSKLRNIAELLQPNTQIKTPTGETRDAQSLIDTFLRNPGPLLKEFKSVPAVLSALQMRLEQGGLDPGVAAALVNRAATQLPAALGQALAISAAPVTDSAVPVGPQSSQRALEPGAPDIRTRRAIPPVAVDPNARRIGSPFAR